MYLLRMYFVRNFNFSLMILCLLTHYACLIVIVMNFLDTEKLTAEELKSQWKTDTDI